MGWRALCMEQQQGWCTRRRAGARMAICKQPQPSTGRRAGGSSGGSRVRPYRQLLPAELVRSCRRGEERNATTYDLLAK